MKHISVFTGIYVLVALPSISQQFLLWRQPEDATLDFRELARKYGYKNQEHELITEDGYILKLFRIPGNKTKPVLLMHGILDSADSFILRGRKSLAAALADEGYDVWAGNTRGNKYSRGHVLYNPDKDNEFWDFSFHEMGVVDLRVFIDFILRKNDEKNLTLIGHSQGNTLFYVLGSQKPEYNAKINLAIALAPVCYLNVENFRAPTSVLIKTGPILNKWLIATNQEELFGKTSLAKHLINNICTRVGLGYMVCGVGLISTIGGEDLEEFESDFFYSAIGHYPTSTSRKDALHLLQLSIRKQFALFDYGREKNLEVYKTERAPLYDLQKVTMKIALLVGKNDYLVPIENVEILRKNLPNVISYYTMERERFNHLDFIWGKNMQTYLYPKIMELLDKYTI